MQDPQENQKFSVQEFANAVREKYPAYNGYSDMEIAKAFAKKYPEYNSQIDFGEQPSKKKEDTEFPSTTGEESTVSYPFSNREEFIKLFRETTGQTKKDLADGVIAYSAAQLYPDLKDMMGVRTEPVQVNWDEESQKAYSKKRTVIDDTPDPETGEINAFKILDEGDPMDFFGEGASPFSKIWNRAIASSEIGKITARSFYIGL